MSEELRKSRPWIFRQRVIGFYWGGLTVLGMAAANIRSPILALAVGVGGGIAMWALTLKVWKREEPHA